MREQPAAEALVALEPVPDFACATEGARVNCIHRRVDGADVYFVASQKPAAEEVECSFRVTGKTPELWHPDTGKTERAPVYAEQEGRTTVRLALDPAGSVFVVFRQPAAGDHAVAVAATTAETVARPVYELKILKAEYGAFTQDEDREWVDVTALVKGSVTRGERRIKATNAMAGDPAPNVVKELKIDFVLDGKPGSVRVAENQTAEIPADAEVVKAVYGLVDETPVPQSQTRDLTERLAALVKDGRLSVRADNALAGGDPAFMVVKQLRVEYEYRGEVKHAHVNENATLVLPVEEAQLNAVPDCELAADQGGAPRLHAWKPGTFAVTTATGKELRGELKDLPQPVELAGPWTLGFPPNWGAPEKVSLDRLVSWTDHGNTDVKYFSGTATYTKSFAWEGGKRAGDRYVLDLGDIRYLAEVQLNGRNLGILWKPPFRLDVTDALRDGRNDLQVKVTNLWPNRLIGDEQLPDDRAWKGKELVGWPQWLLEGKPSPTGRRTFTTWHHWTKDDLPLLSGMLGPVQVRTVREVALR